MNQSEQLCTDFFDEMLRQQGQGRVSITNEPIRNGKMREIGYERSLSAHSAKLYPGYEVTTKKALPTQQDAPKHSIVIRGITNGTDRALMQLLGHGHVVDMPTNMHLNEADEHNALLAALVYVRGKMLPQKFIDEMQSEHGLTYVGPTIIDGEIDESVSPYAVQHRFSTPAFTENLIVSARDESPEHHADSKRLLPYTEWAAYVDDSLLRGRMYTIDPVTRAHNHRDPYQATSSIGTHIQQWLKNPPTYQHSGIIF